MDKHDHVKQVADATTTPENLRAAASKVADAEDTLIEAAIRLEHTDADSLFTKGVSLSDELTAFREEINSTITAESDTFEGFACRVTIYPTSDSGPRRGDYIFEVTEEQRNQRHQFHVYVDEAEDGPDSSGSAVPESMPSYEDEAEGGPGIITSADPVKSISLNTGEELDPGNFGSSAGIAWDNAITALLDAGKFETAEDDAAELLTDPES